MKIGIDARLYGTRHGGIGRYAQKLIEGLEKYDQQNEYVVFLQSDAFDGYQPKNARFTKVRADYRVYGWQEQLVYPRLLKKHKLDLVHFTHFNVPLCYRGRFVVTIHDLIISHYPTTRATTRNHLIYGLKLLFYRLIVKRAARRAEKVIAVSQFTKDDICKLLGVASEKVAVTYEGVDLPENTGTACEASLSQLGIGDKFLLYVGSAYPHKNLEKLLQAFAKLPDGFQLVLVGKDGFFYQRLRKYVMENFDESVSSRIVFAGYQDDDALACLYKSAALYVFPSLIEGFGLPPLEAAHYGLPVVSSNASCLPEILGEGARYFDPENIDEMARIISEVLENDRLRQDLATNGRENLKRFSWDDCARKTLEVLAK